MSSEVELLGCPFCGERLIKTGANFIMWAHPVRSVEEAKCSGAGDVEAAERWNRRSASPSIGRMGVKPLEWEPTGSYPFVAISSYYYIGHQSGDGRYWVHHRIFGDLREGDGTIEHHLTEGAAKAAAQEDHERKILWQIVGSSDPDVAPPNVEHLRPLADREKSAALVYHEEPAGDTQGAAAVGHVKETAETEHVERDVLSGETTHAVGEVDFDALPLLVRIQSVLGDPVVDIEHHLHDVEGLLNEARDALAALVSPPDNGEAVAYLIEYTDRSVGVCFTREEADDIIAETDALAVVHPLYTRAALQSHNEGRDGK